MKTITEINPEIKKIIEDNALGLTTIDKDENPPNIAVDYVKVISKNHVIISDNWLNETITNLKLNPNVALVVWVTNWKENCAGYEFKGTAEYFIEGKWIDFIKKISINKNEPCKGAILVTINKIKILS